MILLKSLGRYQASRDTQSVSSHLMTRSQVEAPSGNGTALNIARWHCHSSFELGFRKILNTRGPLSGFRAITTQSVVPLNGKFFTNCLSWFPKVSLCCQPGCHAIAILCRWTF